MTDMPVMTVFYNSGGTLSLLFQIDDDYSHTVNYIGSMNTLRRDTIFHTRSLLDVRFDMTPQDFIDNFPEEWKIKCKDGQLGRQWFGLVKMVDDYMRSIEGISVYRGASHDRRRLLLLY